MSSNNIITMVGIALIFFFWLFLMWKLVTDPVTETLPKCPSNYVLIRTIDGPACIQGFYVE